ncbi:MAG: hypothetical protein MI923_03130 [Phycisphaerales bacterium]|nr:hypothetical protein [Phycisphaerales bacterium]
MKKRFFREKYSLRTLTSDSYIADIDGCFGKELIISSETTNSSGAPDTPQV